MLRAAGARCFSVVQRPAFNCFAHARRWNSVASFSRVTFGYRDDQPILDEANFAIREGAKVTIMGQNGAGKSTIIKLLAGSLSSSEGRVNVQKGERVSVAKQTMQPECRGMTLTEFFEAEFGSREKPGPKLPGRIHKVLKEVGLEVSSTDRLVGSFSGGQQARLLLAAALITEPSILLLDEPTNNLDHAGIERLTELIEETEKTCLVISHDEDFLNSFTDSVLYLDVFTKSVEAYDGDYWYVKDEISKRIKRENQANARLEREAQKKKDQANVFANKGGNLRFVAKKMREAAKKMESDVVSVRQEDVTLRDFTIPFTEPHDTGPICTINKISTRCPLSGEIKPTSLKNPIQLYRGSRLHIKGTNGIGKTTFLELLAKSEAEGVELASGADVGYYRQDFNNFDFESTAMECFENAGQRMDYSEQEIRKTAAWFFLKAGIVHQRVKTLSEGQKALLSLCCLKLEQPSLLIMDEPTNHVNFRHLPAIANALKDFKGALILVSHDDHMVTDVDCNKTLDLNKELSRAT